MMPRHPAHELDSDAILDGWDPYTDHSIADITYRTRAPRAKGTNPRARRTNPRALAMNPTAGLDSDEGRAVRRKRQAMARLKVRGEHWCQRCEDNGVYVVRWLGAVPELGKCECDVMTLADADEILGMT